MIYDCFIFYDELELLELRLMELAPFVDVFVLCESTHTFTNKPKALHFAENRDRFEPWLDKICYVLHSSKKESNPWRNEDAQRDCLRQGLTSAADVRSEALREDDVVMLSDVDEIPSTDVIPHRPERGAHVCVQHLFYYYVNCFQEQPWPGTIIASPGKLDSFTRWRGEPTLEKLKRRTDLKPIQHAGWHFSFLGGVDKIQRKLGAYAETQTDTPENRDEDHIRKCMDSGEDLFGREDEIFRKSFIRVDGAFPFPRALPEWLEKYPQMVKL